MPPVERICVVCGAKSHRMDWQNAQYPACDSHSKNEVQVAIARSATQTQQSTQPQTTATPIPKV